MGRDNPFYIIMPVRPRGSENAAPLVRALAERVLAGMDRSNVNREAERFLEFVAAGNGIQCGMKGHLLTWGYTSNYGNALSTVQDLVPFWRELWLQEDGPYQTEAVILVSQDEEAERPTACQVRIDVDRFEEDRTVEISVQIAELPFGLLRQA